MTVAELSQRITMPELHEWMTLARVESEERQKAQRIARVESQARANRLRR